MKKEVWDQLSRSEQYTYEQGEKDKLTIRIIRICIFTILGLILASLVGCPRYNVYRSEMNGKAEMKRAEENRKIQSH